MEEASGARLPTARSVPRWLVRVVAGATALFALLAWGVSRLAADQRAPHLPSSGSAAPDSDQSLYGHVLAQTSVFAAVLAVTLVLVVKRRAGFAALGMGGLLLSIVATAGPSSLLPGTLSTGVDTFAAPLGWRLIVAGLVATLALGAATISRLLALGVRASRTARRAIVAPRLHRTSSLVAVGYLAGFGAWGLLQPDAWVSDSNPVPYSVPMTVSFALIGVAVAVAGTQLRGRLGAVALVLLVVGLLAAGAIVWSAYHRLGGAPSAYGWGVMGEELPWYGTRELVLAVVLALPFGFLAARLLARLPALADRLARRTALS